MADLGFMEEMTTILDAIPANAQHLLFSATLDRGVDKLVKRYLNDPVQHSVDSASSPVTALSHWLVQVPGQYKVEAMRRLADNGARTVVFVRTQRAADRVAEQLREVGVLAGALHGGMGQGARNRVLTAFREGKIGVIVATDVAARGIHVDSVEMVLQVDPAGDSKDYLHRAGRTARAGHAGANITLVLPHQRKMVDRMLSEVQVKAETIRGTDSRMESELRAGAGEGELISQEEYEAIVAPRPPRRGGPRRGGPGGGRRPFPGKGRGQGKGYQGGHQGKSGRRPGRD